MYYILCILVQAQWPISFLGSFGCASHTPKFLVQVEDIFLYCSWFLRLEPFPKTFFQGEKLVLYGPQQIIKKNAIILWSNKSEKHRPLTFFQNQIPDKYRVEFWGVLDQTFCFIQIYLNRI